MRVEIRLATDPDTRQQYCRGMVLISESPEESLIMDAVFGTQVVDGVCGQERTAFCGLSDGYGEHFIYIKSGGRPE